MTWISRNDRLGCGTSIKVSWLVWGGNGNCAKMEMEKPSAAGCWIMRLEGRKKRKQYGIMIRKNYRSTGLEDDEMRRKGGLPDWARWYGDPALDPWGGPGDLLMGCIID